VPETNIPVTTSTVLTALEANKARFRLYLKEDDRTLGKDDFQLAVAKYADFIVLDFTLPQDLPKEQYTVTLLGFDFNVTGGSPTQNITATVQPSTPSSLQPRQEKRFNWQLAKFVAFGTSTIASPDSATGLAVMGTLLAADPTGAFFRFTKILQIVNKLYFININYGKRLEAFLAKSATIAKHGQSEAEPSKTWTVFNQANLPEANCQDTR
jgi:hypothetical protein